MPTAARTDLKTSSERSGPPMEDERPAFTWLSAGAFRRLTPAMKDEYVRQIAENFGLKGDPALRE